MSVEVVVPQSMSLLRTEEMEYPQENEVIARNPYASMLGDVIRACMAREILVQLSTDTHEFEKYSRGATKYTRHPHACFKFKSSCTVCGT